MLGKAYSDLLAEYPADVIEEACERWANSSRWWPTWFVLKAVCDRLSMRHIAEHGALTEAVANIGKPKTAPVAAIAQRQETPEERLTAMIETCRKHNREETAAKAEIALAKLQRRDPESWALAVKPKLAKLPPMTWAGNDRLLELAREAREKLLKGDQP